MVLTRPWLRGWRVVGVVACVAAAVVGWQQWADIQLQDQLAAKRAELRHVQAMQQRNAQLKAQIEAEGSAGAADLANARDEVSRLKAELAKAKPDSATAARGERFGSGQIIAAADWKNAGTSTPRATLETLLWAASGGDVDTFSRGLVWSGSARRDAQALLESLPAEERARYGTPERLIAGLTIPDVPNGSIEIRLWRLNPSGIDQVTAIMHAPDGADTSVQLNFVNDAGTWKVVVLDRVVAKLAAQLHGPAAPVASR